MGRQAPKRVGAIVKQCKLVYEKWRIKRWFEEDRQLGTNYSGKPYSVIRLKIKAAGSFERCVPVRLHGVTLWIFITLKAIAARTPISLNCVFVSLCLGLEWYQSLHVPQFADPELVLVMIPGITCLSSDAKWFRLVNPMRACVSVALSALFLPQASCVLMMSIQFLFGLNIKAVSCYF